MSGAGFTLESPTIQALGWTLIDFVWQGALVAAVLALTYALCSRSRPQVRYLAGCAALLVMLALPVSTFLVRAAAIRAERAASLHLQAPPVDGTAAIAARAAGTLAGRSFLRSPDSPRVGAARSGSVPTVGWRASGERVSRSILPWLVGLWSVGVALLSLRLLGGCWLVVRVRRSARNVPLDEWQDHLSRLARRVGVSRPVRLVRSSLVAVPSAIGWLRPVILLPASTLTGLSTAQIDAILLHELAHVRRHDYLVNLLQSAIETLLFYHPAVWWVSGRVREERELCCDDLAVYASGDAVSYAEALYQLERLRGHEAPLALAATGGSLVKRIARLLGRPRRSPLESTRGLAWALVASLVVLVGFAGGAVGGDPRASRGAAVRGEAPRAVEPLRALGTIGAAPRALAALTTLAASPIAPIAAAPAASPLACETPETDESATAEPPTEEDLDDPGHATSPAERFGAEEWERLMSSGVSARYLANLDRAGFERLSADDVLRLAQHGVSAEYAGGVRRAFRDAGVEDVVRLASHGVSLEYVVVMKRGVRAATVEDVVRLASHGVTTEYANAMQRGIGMLDVEDLVRLASHGVSSKYASHMWRRLGRLDVEELVRLASHGVSPEYVEGLRDYGLEDLLAEDLVRLSSSGVTLAWFASMRWNGYLDLTVDRAIELQNSGVGPDHAASLRLLKRDRLTLDELRTLQNQGVDVEYAATMLGLVRRDLTVDQLVRLHQHGVTVEYTASLNAIGYAKLSAEDLIELQRHGVDPEFIAGMSAAGYSRLPVSDLVRMTQHGVTPDLVHRVRDAGHARPTVDELIRFAQQGVSGK